MQKKERKHIELLAPAGDLVRLKTAVVFGADAVYCGLPRWSMRSGREITFTFATLKQGIAFAHQRDVKVYMTINIFPHEVAIKKLPQDLKKIATLDLDGIIVADIGVLSLVRKYTDFPIHLSTQANTVNSAAAEAWKKMGVKRIVLARELTLKEIKQITQKVRGVTFEVFGHGSMCMAYSGRCLLSKYFTNREANCGECAQSCRWRYKIKIKDKVSKIKDEGSLRDDYSRVFLQEEFRPDSLMEVQEDEHGTYFMSSKDLMTLDIIPQLIDAGVDALKIEGRAKSPYYLATVVRAYRHAIDTVCRDSTYAIRGSHVPARRIEGCDPYEELQKELDTLTNRGYSHGFLLGESLYEQQYEVAAIKPPYRFIAQVIHSSQGRILVEVKNKFSVGEEVETLTPDSVYKEKITGIADDRGNETGEAHTPSSRVWLTIENVTTLPAYSVLRKHITH